jgi:hypothetical protein
MKSGDKINHPRIFQHHARLWSLTKIPLGITIAAFAAASLCHSFGVRFAPIFVLLGCLSMIAVILLSVSMSVVEIVSELFYRKQRTIGGVLYTLAFNSIFSGVLILFGYFLVTAMFGLR